MVNSSSATDGGSALLKLWKRLTNLGREAWKKRCDELIEWLSATISWSSRVPDEQKDWLDLNLTTGDKRHTILVRLYRLGRDSADVVVMVVPASKATQAILPPHDDFWVPSSPYRVYHRFWMQGKRTVSEEGKLLIAAIRTHVPDLVCYEDNSLSEVQK